MQRGSNQLKDWKAEWGHCFPSSTAEIIEAKLQRIIKETTTPASASASAVDSADTTTLVSVVCRSNASAPANLSSSSPEPASTKKMTDAPAPVSAGGQSAASVPVPALSPRDQPPAITAQPAHLLGFLWGFLSGIFSVPDPVSVGHPVPTAPATSGFFWTANFRVFTSEDQLDAPDLVYVGGQHNTSVSAVGRVDVPTSDPASVSTQAPQGSSAAPPGLPAVSSDSSGFCTTSPEFPRFCTVPKATAAKSLTSASSKVSRPPGFRVSRGGRGKGCPLIQGPDSKPGTGRQTPRPDYRGPRLHADYQPRVPTRSITTPPTPRVLHAPRRPQTAPRGPPRSISGRIDSCSAHFSRRIPPRKGPLQMFTPLPQTP
ncbi:hypothetical protein CRENBAI_022867 [Crenichthys baileyi]|uniref:Uncharacterized protein n=1 Tax=Crenichthys baileyi TaxID=28760 RepID=A0AAV9RI89_9TELE